MNFSPLVCVVLSVVLSILFVEVTSQTVSCESIETQNIGHGSFKTCFMKTTTTIDSDGFEISPADSSVEAINFNGNKNIHFLPIRIEETFPNIVLYVASLTSIKTVSKKNFGNLKKLRFLSLGGNQIERINSDTFADSTLLEVLHLYANKIKQINGAVFRGLNRLTTVYLQGNICTNSDYLTPTAISTLTRDVTEKCGFTIEENLEKSPKLREILAEILALKSHLKISEDYKAEHQAEIAALKAALKAAEDGKSENIAMMSMVMSQMAAQCNITCIERTKDLSQTVEMKLEEISGLLDEQATNRAAMKEKTAEIALLRKTLETQNNN